MSNVDENFSGKKEFFSLLMYSAIHANDETKLTLIIEEGIDSGLLMDALKMDYSLANQDLFFTHAVSPFQWLIKTSNIKVGQTYIVTQSPKN